MRRLVFVYYVLPVAILLLLLLQQQAVAQITIRDRITVQPAGATMDADGVKAKITEQGQLYYPILQPLGEGKYLVLKSGELKFYFLNAESYGVENREDHVLQYSVLGRATGIQSTAALADYLEGPIVVKEGAPHTCRENQTYFSSEIKLPVNATQDSWVYVFDETSINGKDTDLITYRTSLRGISPDSAESSALIRFDVDKINTNAQLTASHFMIQAYKDSLLIIEDSVFVYRLSDNWSEGTLTFANKPPVIPGSPIIMTNDNIYNEELNAYSVRLDAYVSGWFNKTFADYGILLNSTVDKRFGSREGSWLGGPSLQLTLKVPHKGAPAIHSAGYVEAGDTLSLNYLGMEQELTENYLYDPEDIQAEHRLIFTEAEYCKAENILNVLPFMAEDTTKTSFFEFVLNREALIEPDPLEDEGYSREFRLRPDIRFENGQTLPAWEIFERGITLEVYDNPEISLPEISYTIPLVMGGDSLSGYYEIDYVTLDRTRPDAGINVFTGAEARGKSFKVRVYGELRKGGIILAKTNPFSDIPGVKFKDLPADSADAAYCGLDPAYASQPGVFVNCFEFTIGGEEEEAEIMLGESKFYYAVENPDNTTGLLIKELKTDNYYKDSVTRPADAIRGAFADENIVSVVSGDKPGVYWERKRAVITAAGENTEVSMLELPDGVVRLVGRYWGEGQTYTVKLKAQAQGRSGELDITVTRPSRLGAREMYTDYEGVKHDIDSLAIHYGGKFGMPPQFLKGMISRESSFYAAYRYEAGVDYTYNHWAIEREQAVHESMTVNRYWIQIEEDGSIDLRTPEIPQEHFVFNGNRDSKAVNNYPGFTGTMYDIFISKTGATRQEDIENHEELLAQSDIYSTQYYEDEATADSVLNLWVRDEYRGGLKNIAGQTRQSASYGPLQLIYLYAAYEMGRSSSGGLGPYPVDDVHFPEYLNVNLDFAMNYSLRFYINHKFNPNSFSRNGETTSFSNSSNWIMGFEESLKRGANAYNGLSGDAAPGGGYGKDIWSRALNYLPAK